VAEFAVPARFPARQRGAPAGSRWIGATAIALACLQGCATLPDAKQDRAMPHAQQVDFQGTGGAVSDARSDAIIEKLEGPNGPSDVLDKHLAYEQSVNPDSPLVLGNKLTLLQNGPETYEAMFHAIRAAQDHINLETFIFDDGEAGQQFSELLLQRQAAGVQVNVIHDGVGTLSTPAAFFDHLREGGIRVLEFNPVNPLDAHKLEWTLSNRDHRKLLVIDGRIAFTGGINISDTYASGPSGRRALKKGGRTSKNESVWRDTHIEIKRPAVS
jgi:cardiolipin synthase